MESRQGTGMRNAIPLHTPLQRHERGVQRGDEASVTARREASHKFTHLQEIVTAVFKRVDAFGKDIHPVQHFGLFVPGGAFTEGGFGVEQEFGLH